MIRRVVLLVLVSCAGCLSASPKSVAGDVDDAAVGAETGDDAVQPGEDPGLGADAPSEAAPEAAEPDCGFHVTFALQDDRTHVRVGELAHFEAKVVETDVAVTLWFTADGVPEWAGFADHGDGTADLGVDDQPKKAHTTPVTVTMHAKHLDCELTRTKTVKVVGTVWATEVQDGVVRVFRNDGTSLGIGLPSGKTQQPVSVLELGPNRLVVGSFYQSGGEVYDLDGTWLYSFDTKDGAGQPLFTSSTGGRASMLHAESGEVWLAGWDNRIVVYTDDGAANQGRYKRTIDIDSYQYGNLTIDSLVDLGGEVVLVNSYSLPWSWMVLTAKGEIDIEKWGNNTGDLALKLAYAARSAEGGLVAGGTVQQVGYVVRVNANGILEAKSPYLADFTPEGGVVALGAGVLVATGQNGKITNSLVYFDKDLVPAVDPTFSGDKTGQYRGMMVLGGD